MCVSTFLTIPDVCIPHQILTNEEISLFVDTSDKWIKERTGIHQRYKVAPDQQTSTLGLGAAKECLANCSFSASELTHVIVGTCTPDYLTPSVACVIAGQLTDKPLMAFDISAACAGFIYGASICRSLLYTEPDAKILFICAEALTRRLNWKDRSTCVLFGDGAAASLLTSSPYRKGFAIKDIICKSDGALKDLIIIGGGTSCQYELASEVKEDFFLSMQGRETYRHAVRQMVHVCQELLERNQLSINDINLMVPHQANMRIIEAVGARLKIPFEKVFTNVANYGNTSAASIPIALREAWHQNRIKADDLILITAFGAGLTWGAALLEFTE